MNRHEALEYRRKIEHAAAQQNDEDALQSVDLFPAWAEHLGELLAVGERYRHDGILYAVIQAHVAQVDWTPDKTPALFKVVSLDEWPEWVQPTGAHDAYNKGDKVTHGGQHWTSDIDANVYEPGVFGWTLA